LTLSNPLPGVQPYMRPPRCVKYRNVLHFNVDAFFFKVVGIRLSVLHSRNRVPACRSLDSNGG